MIKEIKKLSLADDGKSEQCHPSVSAVFPLTGCKLCTIVTTIDQQVTATPLKSRGFTGVGYR